MYARGRGDDTKLKLHYVRVIFELCENLFFCPKQHETAILNGCSQITVE